MSPPSMQHARMRERPGVTTSVLEDDDRLTVDEPRAPMRPPGVPAGVFQRKLAQRRAARAEGGAPSDAGRLPSPVQEQMETAFGVDFSAVRIHEGAAATQVGARAFAQGTDLHFAPGEYDPTSLAGQELIGHELAHVVQQRDGRVSAAQGKGGDLAADDGLEAEADRAGARAARGEPAGMQVGEQTATSTSVQLKDEHLTHEHAGRELVLSLGNRRTPMMPSDLTIAATQVDQWFGWPLTILSKGSGAGGPDLEAHRLLSEVAAAAKALFQRGAAEEVVEAEDDLVELHDDTERSQEKLSESSRKVTNLTSDLDEQRGLDRLFTKGRLKKHQARAQRSQQKLQERSRRLQPAKQEYEEAMRAQIEAWPEAQALRAAHAALQEYVKANRDTLAFAEAISKGLIGDVVLALKDPRLFNKRERIIYERRQEEQEGDDDQALA